MSKCEHGLTIKECYVCMSPKYGEKKNNMSIEAMKLVLEALEKFAKGESSGIPVTTLTNTLRQAIEQAEKQEPVKCQYGNGGYACCEGGPCKADEQNNAAPVQEPVGYEKYQAILEGRRNASEDAYFAARSADDSDFNRVLFRHGFNRGYDATTPQPMREWVSLTLDEIWEICKKHDPLQITAYARAIEKALKEKNT